MKQLIIIFSFVISISTYAAINFEDLSSTEVKEIMWDFNAHLLPTNVTPASSLGKIWGIEFGGIAGVSDSPEIDKITGDDDVSKLPHGAMMFAVHFPYGLGIEYNLLPISVDELQYKYYTTGIKWTFTDLLKWTPIDIKLRGNYSKGTISFEQDILGIPVDVDYVYQSLAFNATFSKKLFFIEPYLGLGYIRSSNDLKSTGTISIFNNDVTLSQREGIELSAFYYTFGAQLDLAFVHFAMEVAKINERSKISAKFSFAI